MHILTGLYSPTLGTAKINGLDIKESINKIRQQIGFTPQYNVLFSGMTVREHLWFYGRIKSSDKESSLKCLEKMIDDTNLRVFENDRVEKLSDGLKRKLCVAIAFIGDSKVVILDEPSAGVDPNGRRSIWEILMKYKPGRTIVLCTHHMDEADILSDRVAVIAQGKLVAHGTPYFLKNKFGQGYFLTICKQPFYEPDDCQIEKLKNLSENDSSLFQDSLLDKNNIQDLLIHIFITKKFENANLIENNSSEITYSISNKSGFTKSYGKCFEELENNMNCLGISDVKLTDTNLEEVFLKLTEKISNKKLNLASEKPSLTLIQKIKQTFTINKSRVSPASSSSENISKETVDLYAEYTKLRIQNKYHLLFQQSYALLIKRFHKVKRNIRGMLSETILPLVFVCLALFFSSLGPVITNQPMLEINPWLYSKPNLVFMSYNRSENDSLNFWQGFLSSPGPGTRCLKNHSIYSENNKKLACSLRSCSLLLNKRDSFSNSFKRQQKKLKSYNNNEKCFCLKQEHNCKRPEYEGKSVLKFKLTTNDILYNLTGKNLSDWLIQTEFSHEFFQKRFGGYEIDLNQRLTEYFTSLKNTNNFTLNTLDKIGEILYEKDVKLFTNFSNMFDETSLLTQKTLNIWFNPKGYHSNIAYLNQINNVILRKMLESKNKCRKIDLNEHGIVLYSHPLRLEGSIHINILKKRVLVDLFVAIFITFALAFIPAAFLLNLLEERETNFKQLQFISGVKPYIYWITNFMWDLTNYMIPCLLCFFMFIVYNSKAYTSTQETLSCLFLLFFLYGWACIPLMYPMSFFFKTASSSFVTSSSINVYISVVTITISTVFQELIGEKVDLHGIDEIFKSAFIYVFPHYCLGQGLLDMSIIYYTGEIKKAYGYQVDNSLFKYENIGRNLIFMTVQGFVYFSITILIEYNFFMSKKPKNIPTPNPTIDFIPDDNEEKLDDDVLFEQNRILSTHDLKRSESGSSSFVNCNSDIFFMENVQAKNSSLTNKFCDRSTDCLESDYIKFMNLTKVYDTRFKTNKKVLAVNSITFGLKKGECFGLIGFNGAGIVIQSFYLFIKA
jgi:ATP-binding cassette subfamily A (ABC1) protein 1